MLLACCMLPQRALAQDSREDAAGKQDAIKAIGESAPNRTLIELLAGPQGQRSPNKYVRAVAAQWLGERLAMEGRDALYAAIDDSEPYVQRSAALAYAIVSRCTLEPRLLDRFSARNATTRAVSIAAVRHLLITCQNGHDLQTPHLLDAAAALLQDRDPEVRAEAVYLISLFDGEQFRARKDALVLDTLSDSSAAVRLEGVRALRGTTNPEVVRHLQPLLEDDSDRVQKEVISVLVSSGLPEALDRVREMLGHPRSDFRIAAIRAIVDLGDPAYAADVAAVLDDFNIRVRREAVRAVAELAREDIGQWLVPKLDDRDAGVRLAAAAAFLKYCPKDDDKAAQALALATADFDQDVAFAAADALHCMRSKEIVPELIDALCRASNNKSQKRIAQLLENTTHDSPDSGESCSGWREWLKTDGQAWTHE